MARRQATQTPDEARRKRKLEHMMGKQARALIRAEKWHLVRVQKAEELRPTSPETGAIRYEPRSGNGWLHTVHKVMARKRGPRCSVP